RFRYQGTQLLWAQETSGVSLCPPESRREAGAGLVQGCDPVTAGDGDETTVCVADAVGGGLVLLQENRRKRGIGQAVRPDQRPGHRAPKRSNLGQKARQRLARQGNVR